MAGAEFGGRKGKERRERTQQDFFGCTENLGMVETSISR